MRELSEGYAYTIGPHLSRGKNYSLENAAERLLIVHAYLKADCMVEAIINCDKNDKKERNLRSFVINNVAPSNFYAAWSGGE